MIQREFLKVVKTKRSTADSKVPSLELIHQLAADPEHERRLSQALGQLTDMILRESRWMNLTSDATPEIFWPRHVEDALRAGRAVGQAIGIPGEGRRLLDVGSGAGVPGLIFALLWPEVRVDLLDARRRRVEFLRSTCDRLVSGRIAVHHGRAEQLGHQASFRECFDLVSARAVASLPVTLELTLPFVKPGGHAVAIKSAAIKHELQAAELALETLGAEPVPRLLPYRRSDGKECLVCLVRKHKSTPAGYPRREGLPVRRPLRSKP